MGGGVPPKASASSLPAVEFDKSSEVPSGQQLRDALSQQAVRVIDLFREWDEDGSGVVTQKEFRVAMPLLGLKGFPIKAIDALFDEWDLKLNPEKNVGRLNLRELSKVLRRDEQEAAVAALAESLVRSGTSPVRRDKAAATTKRDESPVQEPVKTGAKPPSPTRRPPGRDPEQGSAADLFAPDLVVVERPVHQFNAPTSAPNRASRLASSPQFDKMLAAADRTSFVSTVASLHGRSPVGSPLSPPPGGWRAGRSRGGHHRASSPGEQPAAPGATDPDAPALPGGGPEGTPSRPMSAGPNPNPNPHPNAQP